MANTRIERIDGGDVFQQAQRMARFGHSDWLVWHDAAGAHAARKSKASLEEMVAAKPKSWTLITANDATPFKGADWLATNLIAQIEAGWS